MMPILTKILISKSFFLQTLQITRQLSSPAATSADIWRAVKPLIRQHECDDGVLVVDDSIAGKNHTDENEMICWHYDNAKQRSVKGINFVSVLYRTDSVTLPVAVELVTKIETYLDDKTGRITRPSSETKNLGMRRMLHICRHNHLCFRYVLADSWYAAADNLKFIKRTLCKDFIVAIKENRKVSLVTDDPKRRRYTPVSQLELTIGEPVQVWLEQLDFPVLLIKQVFTNDDDSTGIRYLITSDLTLTHDRTGTLFKELWSIEVFHKSLKQNAALEKLPTRTENTQRNHFFASVLALVKLERLRLSQNFSHFSIKSRLYLAAVKASFSEIVKLKAQLGPR